MDAIREVKKFLTAGRRVLVAGASQELVEKG
jgi:hypothetical protein